MQVGLGKETKATITLGFTKSNELFVGRLASALPPFCFQELRLPSLYFAVYERWRNSLSAGHVWTVCHLQYTCGEVCSAPAVLGIATAVIGELITGKGALAQLGLETGVPIQELEPLILAGIAFNLIAALLPAKGKFIPGVSKWVPEMGSGKTFADNRVSILGGMCEHTSYTPVLMHLTPFCNALL